MLKPSYFYLKISEDDVRAPIPQTRGVLVEGPYSRGKYYEPSLNILYNDLVKLFPTPMLYYMPNSSMSIEIRKEWSK
jgi:hypothetical protein